MRITPSSSDPGDEVVATSHQRFRTVGRMIALSRGRPRHTPVKGGVGAACVAAFLLSGLAVAAPAHAEDELPILGQAATTSNEDTAETTLDAVISVHGVRRVDGATMVYWSAGFTPGSTPGSSGGYEMVQAFGSESSLSAPRGGLMNMADVAIIDLPARKAYTTMYTGGTKADCLCTPWTEVFTSQPEAGTAYATVAALPPIPQDMDTVTLRVAGQIFLDIPVEDGAMEPVAKGDGQIVVGTGWPKVDTEAITRVQDPSEFVVPLTTHTVIEDSAISERSDADSRSLDLSADVLFAFDKATLTSKANKEITAAAQKVEDADVSGTITVTGHTDADGAAAYNRDLSERRAASVAETLKPLLASGVTLKTAGKGESEPIAPNDTEAGKALNRRVTITLPENQR